MNWSTFRDQCAFFDLEEGEKAKILIFFHRVKSGKKLFTQQELKQWFTDVGLAPNISRLLAKAKWITRSAKNGPFELNGAAFHALEKLYPSLKGGSLDLECTGEFLPKDLYSGINRKYIVKIADQANWAYENRAYDACAVMVRRLAEILLVHVFIAHQEVGLIKGADDRYFGLEKIISISEKHYSSSGLTQKDVKALKECKSLGDLSAHDITYTRKQDELDNIKIEVRVLISHLLAIAKLSS